MVVRHKIIDGMPYKIIGRISIQETLEALIPAIMEIEGGYYANVCEFISDANRGLTEIGSPYRFESTSKICWPGELAEGVYVDNITVIEVTTKADLEDQIPSIMRYHDGCYDCVTEFIEGENERLKSKGIKFRFEATPSSTKEFGFGISGSPHGRCVDSIIVIEVE